MAIQNAVNAANGTGNTKTVVKSQPAAGPAGQTVPNSGLPNLGGKQCTQYLSITPLEKINGKYKPKPVVHVHKCPVKPRVNICGQVKGVGKGDTFQINGKTVVLSGGSSLTKVKQEIEAQVGNEVTVTFNTINGETCISIKNIIRDAMVIRNGCAGGVFREVLDYALQRDQQNCFQPTTEVRDTTSVSTARNQLNQVTDNPGRTQTIKAVPKYTRRTAEENSKIPGFQGLSSMCETKGQGYKVGDKLRVVGGVPVANDSVVEAGVIGLRIINAGSGYNIQGGNDIELIVRSSDSTAEPLRYDVNNLSFDENGGIQGVNVALEEKDGHKKGDIIPDPKQGPGIIPIQRDSNGKLLGGSYKRSSAPTVTVRGAGQGAVIVPIMDFGKDAEYVERPAKFLVTRVDEQGAITDLSVQDRGVYQQFPSDQTQGVPLEYDISRPTGTLTEAQPAKANLGSGASRGAGKGARVFLTGRAIPDCSQQGNALNGLGLKEGTVKAPSEEQGFADTLNDYSPYGPDGFPLWTASIEDDEDGNPGLVIDAPTLDGLDFNDDLNPGLLDDMNMYPGAYTTDDALRVGLADAGSGGPFGNGQGLKLSGQFANGLPS